MYRFKNIFMIFYVFEIFLKLIKGRFWQIKPHNNIKKKKNSEFNMKFTVKFKLKSEVYKKFIICKIN